MRTHGFSGQPNEEVLARMEQKNDSVMLVDIERLRAYIRQRFREENISLYTLAEKTGIPRATFVAGQSASLDRFERLLYIVDGTVDKWYAYIGMGQNEQTEAPDEQTNEPNEQSGLSLERFMKIYPDAEVYTDYSDRWVIVANNRTMEYDKNDYTLELALEDAAR